MFGFIMLLMILILKAIGSLLEVNENNRQRVNYRNANDLTYIDSKARTRLLVNNHFAEYTRCALNHYGDYVLIDEVNGKIIRNFSQEEREKRQELEIKRAKEQNLQVYCIDCDINYNYIQNKHNGFNGRRYKSFETGAIYVIRHFYDRYYYMDITNGFLLCETEESKKQNSVETLFNQMINIEEFNKQQGIRMFNYNWQHDEFNDNYYVLKLEDYTR